MLQSKPFVMCCLWSVLASAWTRLLLHESLLMLVLGVAEVVLGVVLVVAIPVARSRPARWSYFAQQPS